MFRTLLSSAISMLLFSAATQTIVGQSLPTTGPLIKSFGKVYEVPDPGLPVETEQVFRVLFDVADSPPEKDRLNPAIDTLARFLNMHSQAGVPKKNLQVAVVLHGSAAKDALINTAYRARYGIDNPNTKLLDALSAVGVRAYLCGQTAASQQIAREDLTRPVEMALSAMTALVLLQEQGYRLIPW